MTTPTTNLNLITYHTVTDASALFQKFREDVAGDSVASNMGIIDAWAGSVSGSIASLSGFTGTNTVSASYVSESFYAASASALTSYRKDMIITLIIDRTNDGTVTLNINSLGIKALNKIDVNGNKVNFTGKELVKNKPNSFIYDGSVWLWLGSSSSDQIYVSGSQNNLTTIGASGILTSSGINASSIALANGSYVVLSLNPNLTNEWLLTAGSGISLTQDSNASTITLSSYVSSSTIAPSNASYIVLSLNSNLSNEWLLTAGSNVTLTQNASASTIIIDTTLSASSVATNGSYVMLSLHPNITGEWLLTAGDNIKITQNASASTVTIDTVIAASSMAPSTASYVLLGIDPSLQKGLVLTGGSNVTITTDTLAGTVKINANPSSNSFFIDQTGGTGDTYGVISGSINGTNKTFTVSQGKYASGSLEVYLNGQLQTQGTVEDWNETSPESGTFTFVTAPVAGDLITAKYMVTIVTTANADTLDNFHASAFMLKGEDISSGSVSFVEAGTLLNVTSGENLSVLFGKIKKLFSSYISGSYILSILNPDLPNAKKISSSNGISINNDTSSSSIIISGSSLLLDPETRNGKKFIIVNPYKKGGSLHLKGQMHCHGNYSNATRKDDGANSASSIMVAYKNVGYNFATVTGHSIITPDPGVADITWLADSVEYGYIMDGSGGSAISLKHIVVYGETEYYVPLYQEYDTQHLVNDSFADNKLVNLAHPNWSSYYKTSKSYMESIHNLNFVEVFNNLAGGEAEDQWDWNLSIGNRTFALAVDDCHDVNNSSWFNKGWVVVHTNENSASSIINSLREGNFYSSTGNDITVALSGETLTAYSTNNSNFKFISRNGNVLKEENNVKTSSYTIIGNESYIRVRSALVSSSGSIAWSQPFFIETLSPDSEEIGKINSQIYNNSIDNNLIINGNMDIWQRGTIFSASSTSASETYTADMFYYAKSGTANFNISRSTSIPTLLKAENEAMTYSLLSTCSTADTSLTGGDFSYIGYRMEGYDCSQLIGKTVTLSWWAKSSASGTYCVGLGSYLYKNSYVAEYNIDVPNSWEKKEITFYFPSYNGDFPNNSKALDIRWTLSSSVTYITSSSSVWVSGNYFATSNQTNLANARNNNFSLTQIKLEIGDIATPFYPRNHWEELDRCKRYFQKSVSENSLLYDGMSRSSSYMVTAITTSTARASLDIRPEMRNTPKISFYRTADGSTSGSAAIFTGSSWEDCNIAGASSATSSNLSISITKSGLAFGSSYQLSVGWGLDASL